MPLDQGRERRLIALGEKPFEEFAVGQARHSPLDEETLNLPQCGAHRSRRHDRCPPGSLSYPYVRDGSPARTINIIRKEDGIPRLPRNPQTS